MLRDLCPACAILCLLIAGCSSKSDSAGSGGSAPIAIGGASGAATSAGGSATANTGGTTTGASGGSTGGAISTGGSATGGNATGGMVSTGGSASLTPGGSGGMSSGGTGGASNAGSGGGSTGGTAGATGLDCTGRLVCEDFEATALGTTPGDPWNVNPNKGSVTIDDTRAVSGQHAVKVSVQATATDDTYRQAYLTINSAPLFPLANNRVFGRFMIYADRIPDQTVHWTFAHGAGPYNANSATYNYGGMGGMMANYYRDTSPQVTDCWQTKDVPFPSGHWQCVAFEFDGQANEMRFWLGPDEVPELHVLGNQKTDQTCTEKGIDGAWYAPAPFQTLSIGWESYQHDVAGAHDAWIDDIVLDDEMIACP